MLRMTSMIGFAWVLAFCAAIPCVAKDGPPNVLFIFADDHAFEAVRAFGNGGIETPNIDRLARRGLTFTHAYNQGSWTGAVCEASRTMLNTGRSLWNAHKLTRSVEPERRAGRFWSEHMKKAGYDTYFSGKWHVRVSTGLAFDYVSHERPGMPRDTEAGYNRPLEGRPDVWKPWDEKFGGFWQGGKHWSEVLGDDATRFIDQAAGREQPFFMYFAFNAPHDPRQSPKEYLDKYPLDKVAVPASYVPEYPYKDAIGCGPELRDEKLGPFPRTEHAVKVHRQEYYAIITHMDAQIGRILDALERSGRADNTYIFFTADHGLAVGHQGLFGKQNLYDHSVRVPFIVVGPGVPTAAKVSAPIYLQDIMPTTLELAGVDKPEHVEFHSLLPLIRGETKKSAYDAIYGAYKALQRSVVVGSEKLIVYPQVPKIRLYDLAKDPLEMNDLAGSSDSKVRIAKLFAKLRELQREMGDELDLGATFPAL